MYIALYTEFSIITRSSDGGVWLYFPTLLLLFLLIWTILLNYQRHFLIIFNILLQYAEVANLILNYVDIIAGRVLEGVSVGPVEHVVDVEVYKVLLDEAESHYYYGFGGSKLLGLELHQEYVHPYVHSKHYQY
jgi:hypothetical protein